MPKVKTKLVSWDEIVSWSRDVAQKVLDSGYNPELVVAIARGGYVPARLVCDFLMIENLVSLQSQHWTEAAKAEEKAVIKYPYKLDLKGGKVLIVDDIVDTGESLLLAKDYILRNWNVSEVRIAVLQWISPVAKFKPDYYSVEVKDWVWFQYPWTRLEDTFQFLRRMLMEEGKYKTVWTYEEIISKFMEWYELDVGERYFKDAIEWLIKKGILKHEGNTYVLTR
ncbi:MAG: phosphoribosyl transferase [Zestosphaera tikiterensis]|uniref:Phosphoribosyl transferase n=1 Tax=Zestosphaera tikiterensis TaxID=1973259 RepID=A0A2R7Y7K8_9CREN|nr:MAG: phosphoribosyl transferase [Zestosphaera tikiterensis]